MSVSIVTCPECKSLLLSDTAQCPNCHHMLHKHQTVNLSELKTHSEVMGSSSNDIACPDCGEMVRKELVRCYQCGAFLRKEMAESYQRMRDNVPEVTSPALRELSSRPARTIPSAPVTPVSSELPPLADDDDDDFALGAGVTAVAPGQASGPAPTGAGNESYSLNAPAPGSPPASAAATAELPDIPLAEPGTGAEKPATGAPAGQVPHSEATAGDVLLDIAKQEEEESEGRRKLRGKRKPGPGGARSGFVIFCPWGHQIEVQEKHRGQMGKCPRCKAAFIVPQAPPEPKSEEAASPTTDAAAAAAVAEPVGTLAAGKFTRWLKDVHIHPLDPTKLKLKPGSLESTFETQDVGFGLDGLLLLTLSKKGGMFGGADKKKPEARDAAVAHLAAGKPLAELQVAAQRIFAADTIKQIQVVQPVVYAHESMFAGIPVFGNNRIAVRLPKPADSKDLLFASFWLSEFREFSKQMNEVFSIAELGDDVGVPLTDKLLEHKCHYTEQMFQALDEVAYHQADPNIKLAIVGRKCEGCGLIISEDGRKKEKLGGADGKGIAKAKCPKCQKKFGSFTFYMVEAAPPAEPHVEAAKS
ncbi:MAG: hypothetical protein ACKV2Q_25270 [Planctomycetaceae bacterium]